MPQLPIYLPTPGTAGSDSHYEVHRKNAANVADHEARLALAEAKLAQVVGALNYRGTWNALTNAPALTSGVGVKGDMFKVSTTGVTNLDGTTAWYPGDMVVFNGTWWDRIDGGSTEVVSVNGKVGLVKLDTADIESGLFDRARFSTGTGSPGYYLDYDLSWKPLPSGGGSSIPGVLSAAAAGVTADGTTFDTNAWVTVLATAAAIGAEVEAPAGVSRVSYFSIPAGVTVRGRPVYTYIGMPTLGSIIKCTDAAQTTPIISLGSGSGLRSIGIVGAGNAQSVGVKATGGFSVIDDCNISYCGDAIDANYFSLRITNNRLHNNRNTVINPVDSNVTGNYMNGNSNDGLYLGPGANDNYISKNKIEWNEGRNVNIDGAKNNIICMNIVDRAGKQGFSVKDTFQTVIADNLVRRSGKNSQGNAREDVHFWLENNTGLKMRGNVTAAGANDDDQGYNSPAYAIAGQNNVKTQIDGNDLSGYVSAFFGEVTNPGWTLGDNDGQPITLTNVTTQRVIASGQISPATGGGSASISFAGFAIGNYSIGWSVELTLMSRNPNDGSRSAAVVRVLVGREGGNATATVAVLNTVGTVYGTTSSPINISATPAANGASLTVTFTNTSAAGHQVKHVVQRYEAAA